MTTPARRRRPRPEPGPGRAALAPVPRAPDPGLRAVGIGDAPRTPGARHSPLGRPEDAARRTAERTRSAEARAEPPRSADARPQPCAAREPSTRPEGHPSRSVAGPERRSTGAEPRRAARRGGASLVAAQSHSSLVRIPAAPADDPDGYVVEAPAPTGGDIPAFQTHFFESIRSIRAQAVAKQQRALRTRSLAETRGYARDDLYAIAEIAYHYLFNGGFRLALVLYEGLTAVAPDEAYFALALGLTHDHLGNREAAFHWYQRAGVLDPAEPRADLNQAELFLQVRDVRKAQVLLDRGLHKARARGDEALERKARALLRHTGKR